MEGTIVIFNKELEHDFLSAWIKYNRLQNEFSQEALAYGICSTSHLSYFESGKKKLREEIIEALLKKLNIYEIDDKFNIGKIRHKFYDMLFEIESYNEENAERLHAELLEMEDLISISPYNIEYKIYQLSYNIFIERLSYNTLKQDILTLDKIYTSLNKELQYLYLLISGKIIFKYKSHNEGIQRLILAQNLKDTSWVNFTLGSSYCFDNEPFKGIYYLEKALETYEKSGRYINATWCHNYLGICFSYLKLYEEAEKHYNAALMATKHFNMDKLFWHLYTNLSHLYFCKENYIESIKWSTLALNTHEDLLLPASNYVDACIKLNRIDECNEIFRKYLREEYKSSIYYNYLYFMYLSIFEFDKESFYENVTKIILPYYETLNNIDICKQIRIKLIEYLEKKRRYKEANQIYKGFIL